MQKCQYCDNEYKGQRGITTHQKTCAAFKAAALQRIIAEVKPKFATVAPPISHEVWRGHKSGSPQRWGDESHYNTTGEVDQTTGNYVYTVWDTHSAGILRIQNPRHGGATIRERLATPRVIGKVARAAGDGVVLSPVRIYEYGEAMPPITYDGASTTITKVELE
jgi:hypothetical protein